MSCDWVWTCSCSCTMAASSLRRRARRGAEAAAEPPNDKGNPEEDEEAPRAARPRSALKDLSGASATYLRMASLERRARILIFETSTPRAASVCAPAEEADSRGRRKRLANLCPKAFEDDYHRRLLRHPARRGREQGRAVGRSEPTVLEPLEVLDCQVVWAGEFQYVAQARQRPLDPSAMWSVFEAGRCQDTSMASWSNDQADTVDVLTSVSRSRNVTASNVR